MVELLSFLKTIEVWVYLVLGVIGLFPLKKILSAWGDLQRATFGLERENAQRRLSEAAGLFFLLGLLAAGEFLLVTFVSPSIPGIQALATPTLDVLATPTATLPAGLSAPAVSTSLAAATPAPVNPVQATGCITDRMEFTFPASGEEIKGKVTLKGTVDIPDFGFYKYEFSPPGSSTWTTIAAGNELKNQADLGPWDTTQILPGEYLLRLVATDHQGDELPACIIPVRIAAP
jgi:hypothetical protein